MAETSACGLAPRPRSWRRGTVVLGMFLVALGVLTGRMLLGARNELAAATLARERGAWETEVRHLRRAMAYYVPGSPYVRRACARLRETVEDALAHGDRERATVTLEELRSAILSLRGISRPYAEVLPEVNRRLAALRAADPEGASVLHTPAGASQLLTRLTHPPEPQRLWSTLGLVGFLLWLGGALALIYGGLRPDAAIVGRRALPRVAVVVLGLALFVLGMALA